MKRAPSELERKLPAQMMSFFPDRGAKLRSPSLSALVWSQSVMLVKNQIKPGSHRIMVHSQRGGQSKARPPMYKSPSKLGTHFSTNYRRDESTLPSPGIEPGPVLWKHDTLPLDYWSEANPQVYVETPLHPGKLTVWYALWAGGIIGPYFFKNDEGHNVTVNGVWYRAMITNFFIPELNNHDVQELWFQQDGATCHTARATIDLLKDTLGDRLISRFGPVNRSPRSCDLTPLDYFLWGYVKSLVYADKPQTLDHLEDNIRRVIADIWPQMLEKVIENWTSRLDYIRASGGSPMPEIIFKM
ncbi:putative transposase [Trichonephila clavipes]|nr:putative transposase [Trichonephila clavipes]